MGLRAPILISVLSGLKSWDGTLYNAGDEYEKQTGGWESFAPKDYGMGTATKNTANLTVLAESEYDYWFSAAFGTVNSIDLTGYSTLHIYATIASGGSGDSATKFGVASTKDGATWDDTPQAVFSAGETTLDISSVDYGFVWFGAAQRSAGSKSASVTRVWLT